MNASGTDPSDFDIGHKKLPKLVRLPLQAEGLSIGRELVLAEPLPQDTYRVRSIPAYVYGLAAEDTVRILDRDTGSFELVKRGGQVTIRVFVDGTLTRPDVRALVDAVSSAGGLHEVGSNDDDPEGISLLMISLDVKLGFSKIESLMRTVPGPDVRWEYGNVYDADGAPLNWWAH